ncbi:MAG: N-acetylmuramoyl-L-alanine amidase [Bacteroidales bacterium]|jgi:N-acetyl-anhydromuramyl-L-alanine amidase AmpD|nr:N-acetylmuramoyl-L-alanine amidase [Bacteroidales bacterium]
MNIKQKALPEGQYVRENTVKRQIVLHHTASGPGIDGDYQWWKSTPERVATHFIIDREGQVWQLFPEENWAFHLGLSKTHFAKFGLAWQNLDRQSIGIELDSWGPVVRDTDGRFYPLGMKGRARPVVNVHEYCRSNPFKGHVFWEAYTDPQLMALRELLNGLCRRHSISREYHSSMWAVLPDALRGCNGIYTHCSYRQDKFDCHPQPQLVNVLKTIG